MNGSAVKLLITSQKGGVGKSTLAANLAAYLTHVDERKTALLDFDHQATSSKWLRSASNSKVRVENHSRSGPQPLGVMALNAASAVRRAAANHDVVVADLTWHDLLPAEFLFDFDFVLVPCSLSRIEIDSTLDFVGRLSHVFKSQRRTPPKLIIVPSAIRNIDDYHAVMGRYFNFEFFLSPPVVHSENAQDSFCDRFLYADRQSEVRDNFMEFARSVSIQLDQVVGQVRRNKASVAAPVRVTPRGDSPVLDRFLQERAKGQQPAADMVPRNAQGSRVIPGFLRSVVQRNANS